MQECSAAAGKKEVKTLQEGAKGGRVRAFLNQKSGAGEASAERLSLLFAAEGTTCEITHVGPACSEEEMRRLARQDPADVAFIAAGGDGTVNAVASVVAGSTRRMGVLPCGTLNHFARDLGLPLGLEEAVRVAAGQETRVVDAAQVNGRVFVNNSALGVYPLMVMDRERLKRGGWNKWASLVIASIKAFVRFRCIEIEFGVQGGRRCYTTPLVLIGNNEYCLEGTRLGRRERLDRGELAVYLAPGASRMSMLRMVLAALFGRLKRLPDFEEHRVQQMTVTMRGRRLRVALDGEVRRMAGPLRYKTLPGALQVLCAAPVGATEVVREGAPEAVREEALQTVR